MPLIDVGRSRFTVKFFDHEKNGPRTMFDLYRSLQIAEPPMPDIKTQKYYLNGTLTNAYELKRVFKEEPWKWEVTNKYKEYCKKLYINEKEFADLRNVVEKIKLSDPADIGRLLSNGYEIDGYKFKTVPWDHQKIGFRLIREIKNIMLTWDMRCGKTFIVANCLQDMIQRKVVKKAVVFCPSGIMESVWIRDVYRHTNLQGMALIQKSAQDRITNSVQSQITIPEDNGTFNYVYGTPNYFVFNHDAIRNPKILQHIMEVIDPDALIVDESHAFKTPNAGRTKAMMTLAEFIHAKNGSVVCMSGTPVAKDIRDIYAQATIVDSKIFPFTFNAYKQKYCCIAGGYNFKTKTKHPEKMLGTKNQDDLKARYEVRSFKVIIEDCHDMPEVHETIEDIELSDEQREHHDMLLQELITEVKGNVITATSLTKFMKMAQISCGYIHTPEGEIVRLDKNPKLDSLRDHLEQILSVDGRKVVVYTNYRPTIPMIRELLNDMEISFCELSTQSKMDRNESEFKFQNDPQYRVMLAAPALTEGKDFSKASYAIYFDNNYRFVHRDQSRRRIYTSDSKVHGRVTYIDLIGKNSVDEIIYESILTKADTNKIITEERLKALFKGGRRR